MPSYTEKRIATWLAGIGAGATAVGGVLLGVPGDVVAQGVVLTFVATGAGLMALTAVVLGKLPASE